MPAPDSTHHSFSNGRRWLNWLNIFVAAAAVLALVVMANYLAYGHFKRFQVDRDSSFKLSAQTLHVLEALTNDVKVTLFFQPHGKNEEIYALASGLLKEYQQTAPQHIDVKTLDYNRDVGEAKEFLARYNLDGIKEKDFVFFQCGARTKLVNAKDLSQYDMDDLISGRSKYVRRSAFLGEIYFTSDIYDVSSAQAMTAYFLTGHGENDPEEDKVATGYSKLAGILTNELNCSWQKLSLEGTNEVPANCAVLIVPAGAREGMLTPAELDKISAYLKQGGRMLALLTAPSGLESILADWGVVLGDSRTGRIMDTDKSFEISKESFLTARLSTHAIMASLAGEKMALLMVFPRPVSSVESQSKQPGAPEVTILAATSDHGENEAGQLRAYPLLVAVEQGGIQGVKSAGGRGTRMVVAGDSYFLDDQVIDSVGNHVFANKALSWLLQRPQIMLEGLGPRPLKEYKLYMTPAQSEAIRWLFLAGMPGAVLLVGALVWLRRRS